MSTLPRVAFTHYSQKGDIGGVTTWLLGLAKRLQKDGYCVGIQLYEEAPPNDDLLVELRSHDIHIECHSNPGDSEADIRSTLNFINNWKPTVFFPQCLHPTFIAAGMAGRRGLPWALTVHSDDTQYWSALEVVVPPRHNGRTVCVSKHLAEEVRRRGIDKHPLVIPCGVKVPDSIAHPGADTFRVAYSGRIIEYQKRVSLVIRSLMLACQQNPRISAVVIGDGSSLGDWQRVVDDAGLNHAITFSGRVDPSEVPKLLGECQAILLMSDYEGLPVALMEAMAQGVVPIARHIASGIPELVENRRTGLLVSADPMEAAAAICTLSNDQLLWGSCSQAARGLISQHYSEDITYSQWTTLIDNLHRHHRPSYPIRFPLLALSTKTFCARMNAYSARRNFILQSEQNLRTLSARFKHTLKSWAPWLRSAIRGLWK